MSDRGEERPSGLEQDFERWRRDADSAALGRVFDQLAPELMIIAVHVADRWTAEDLVQTTFLHAIDRAERWESSRPLLPWLVGILVKHSLRERAAARREVDPARLTIRSAPGPVSEAERLELAQAVGEALNDLPIHYRRVLTLRLVHGLEPTAIANALRSPIATVKSQLRRGLTRLRDALPSSLQLPAALLTSSGSLESVREVVLSHASTQAATLTTAASTTTLFFGGALFVTKLTAAAAALAALVYFGWILTPGSKVEPMAVESGRAALLETPPGEPEDLVATSLDPPPTISPTEREAIESSSPPEAAPTVAVDDEPSAPTAPPVRGRVVDEKGDPLPGVLVLLGDQRVTPFTSDASFTWQVSRGGPMQPGGHADVRQTTTNEQGAFLLDRPRTSAPYRLFASRSDRGVRSLTLPDEGPVEIVLPIDALVSGTVRSAVDQAPIEGATIQVWPWDDGNLVARQLTDAAGEYELPRVPPGKYSVSIRGAGFAELETEFWLGFGQADSHRVHELEPLMRLDVQLVDEAQEPWTPTRLNATLADDVALGSEWFATLSKRSYASFGELKSDVWRVQRMTLSQQGHVSGPVWEPDSRVLALWYGSEKFAEATLPSLTAETVVMELPAPSSVTLHVRILFEPEMTAAAPIRVSISDASGFSVAAKPVRTVTTSHRVCSLAVPASLVGGRIGLLVESEGCAPHLGKLSVPIETSDLLAEVVLSPAQGTLKGMIIDASGAPLPNARLTIVSENGDTCLPFRRSTRETGSSGRFSIEGLPTRPLLAMVMCPEFASRSFEVDPVSGHDYRLELTEGRRHLCKVPDSVDTLQIRVLDGAGRPLFDDRISGMVRFGSSYLMLDRRAATVEVYDAVGGAQVCRGVVPESGPLVMEPVD